MARRCCMRPRTPPYPEITVVLRKAYGAGHYVMCGRAYEPDLIVAWPSPATVAQARELLGLRALASA